MDAIAQQAASRGKELVLFTDMPRAAASTMAAVQMLVKYPHVHVISGANLIMLMEFCLSERTDTPSRFPGRGYRRQRCDAA